MTCNLACLPETCISFSIHSIPCMNSMQSIKESLVFRCRRPIPCRQPHGPDRHAAPHQRHQRSRWVCHWAHIPHWPPCTWYAHVLFTSDVQRGHTYSLSSCLKAGLTQLTKPQADLSRMPEPWVKSTKPLFSSAPYSAFSAPTCRTVLPVTCRRGQPAVGHTGNPRPVSQRHQYRGACSQLIAAAWSPWSRSVPSAVLVWSHQRTVSSALNVSIFGIQPPALLRCVQLVSLGSQP